MPRPAASLARAAERSSGSAAIARARLHSALARDRSSLAGEHSEPSVSLRAPAQPDLLELLLAQGAASGRGRS
jgi:hypothetical protein